MHCPKCGSAIVTGSAFCPACGRPLLESSQNTRRESKSLVGFSPKINDPAFARYQKASSSWAMIFAGALALIAIVGFPIYGRMSGELEMPTVALLRHGHRRDVHCDSSCADCSPRP